MPVLSRRIRGTIFLDNIDFKRLAREYLRSASLASPASLDESLSRVAQWCGYPNLHALTDESRHGRSESPLPSGGEAHLGGGSRLDDVPAADGAAYVIHPLVASGQVLAPARHRIAAEGLVQTLNELLLHLKLTRNVSLDVEGAWWLLKLETVERSAFDLAADLPIDRSLQDSFGTQEQSIQDRLTRYLSRLPGWQLDRAGQQRDEVVEAHHDITALIDVVRASSK